MALAFLNRCGFRATSTGTGSFVVASALTGMYAPASCANPAMVDGATYRYFAQSDDLTQHEEGYGVWTSGTSTLTRAVILSSTNSNNAVGFSAAPQVFMGGPLAADALLWLPYVSLPFGGFTGPFDLSGNLAVRQVNLSSNQFTAANFSGCAFLETLDCNSNNSLTSLSLDGCTSLTSLTGIGNFFLTAIDLSEVTGLVTLDLAGGGVTALDVSSCSLLEDLNVSFCVNLASIDLTNASALTELRASDCSALTALDLTDCNTLADCNISNCSLATLVLPPDIASSLIVSNNSLTSIDITGFTLGSLDASGNGLTSVTLSGAVNLSEVILSDNALTTIDITDNVLLNSIELQNNALTEAQVDGVLVQLDTNATTDGSVDLSSGTNATPSATGLAAKASLEGKGWTVTVN